jgi:Caspase domain
VDGRRKALIVANDEYEHDGLNRLLAPAADAEALAGVLGDAQIGDFDVQVVRNEPSYVIQGQIEDIFSESRPDDVLLVHFSCHGLKSESGELFFAARNTRPNRLGSTAISADFVQRCMRASRSRSIVLLLDCCYGGAFSQGVTVRAAGDVNVLDAFPGGRLGGGRGRAVITASSAMEYAFEGDRLADDHSPQPSVFTSALVEGLASGDADRDEDGWVSLNELYDYVFDKVRGQNPHQTPSRDVEMQGELYLARSQRRRIRAAPIPPDLEAARTDPHIYTRLGAVSELRSRLAGDNLEAALGARDALADTARTDIRYVAEPAKAALDEATVRLAETELHLGQIEQHSASPHRTVRLLGPPLARACVPRASHDWIRVQETPDGLDISIDTAGVGRLRGSVEVKGPTGDAVVTIDVELIPRPPQPSSRPLTPLGTEEPTGGDAEPTGDRIPALKATPNDLTAPDAQELLQPEQQTRDHPAHGYTAGDDVPPTADGPTETAPTRPRPPEPTLDTAPARADWQLRQPRHRRLVYAGAAVVLAIAGTTAGLLISNRSDPPTASGHSTSATFKATSPWRLVISDRISGSDPGCAVTVTNTGTGEKKEIRDSYGTRSYQMQDSGNFRWEANSSECLVIQRPGPGKVTLPFVQEVGTGDTEAFHAPGRIAVEVKDFHGGTTCELVLHDAADGRPVDFGTAQQGSPLLLDPSGSSQVYLADLGCGVRVSAE